MNADAWFHAIRGKMRLANVFSVAEEEPFVTSKIFAVCFNKEH